MKEKLTLRKVANDYLTHTRQNKGITLVALVITIIILLILAGIAIASLTQTGLFAKAQNAKDKAENAQAEENLTLGEYENLINDYEHGISRPETISAELFSFTPADANWKVENVKQALDYLYNN